MQKKPPDRAIPVKRPHGLTSSQSPLSDVSACRRKLRALPCSSYPKQRFLLCRGTIICSNTPGVPLRTSGRTELHHSRQRPSPAPLSWPRSPGTAPSTPEPLPSVLKFWDSAFQIPPPLFCTTPPPAPTPATRSPALRRIFPCFLWCRRHPHADRNGISPGSGRRWTATGKSCRSICSIRALPFPVTKGTKHSKYSKAIGVNLLGILSTVVMLVCRQDFNAQ